MEKTTERRIFVGKTIFFKTMKATSMYIRLEGIRLFAYHGVNPQENVVGANFLIDLRLKTDFSHAAQTDELSGTISYADVFERLKEEMKIPSKLLEHVCERIATRLFRDFPMIEAIDLRLSKENPPMGSDCQSVGVEAHYEQSMKRTTTNPFTH